jgi:hypothetical protein
VFVGVVDRARVRLAAPGASWLEATVTLPHGIDRVDLSYRLSKVAAQAKESAFISFPFRSAPDGLRCEITGGVDRPDAPHIPGSASHMRAIRHWISLSGRGRRIDSATLESPLVQVGNLHLPYAPFPPTLEPEDRGQSTIYSWIHNNIWDTNFPASRGGEIEFHYAISTADPNDGTGPARRLAESLTAPLLCLVAGATRPEVAPAGSFSEFAGDDVELVAVRRPRFGHDLAVLVQSGAGDADVTLRLPSLAVRRTWIGDHLERELVECVVADGVVRARLHRGRLSTVLLDLGDSGY